MTVTDKRTRTPLFFLTIMSLFATTQAIAQVALPDSATLTYEGDIRYALVRTCFECHSGGENRGELLLDTYDGIMRGGEHGPAIVPGSPEKSILFQKISSDPPFGKQMPRKRDLKLSFYEISMIRTWIEQGARRGIPDSLDQKQSVSH